LLAAYTLNAGYAGDASAATQRAGVSQVAVAAGDRGAIALMVQLAKNEPKILEVVANAFLRRHPEIAFSYGGNARLRGIQ
jgi:hypothetical protein